MTTHMPSPYIQFYASRMVHDQMRDQFGDGFLSTMGELFNPFTAGKTLSKYGPSLYTTRLAEELRDYKDVKTNISDRYGVLVKGATKLKNTPFPANLKPKTLTGYKGSGVFNLFSQSPSSQAEAMVIGAGFYYLLGNAYNNPKMTAIGNRLLNSSNKASKSGDPQAAVATLIKVGKSINKDAKATGIVPKWYNIFGNIAWMFNKDKIVPFTKSTIKLMQTPGEIDFAMTMRKERGQDKSPLAAFGTVIGMVIGGAVLWFTFPVWFPLVKSAGVAVMRFGRSAVGKGAKLAGKGIKVAGKSATKTTKSIGTKTVESAKQGMTGLFKEAAEAAKKFDAGKFSEDVQQIIHGMRIQGQEPSVKSIMETEQIRRLVAQSQGTNVSKPQMKKLLLQLLKEVKEQTKAQEKAEKQLKQTAAQEEKRLKKLQAQAIIAEAKLRKKAAQQEKSQAQTIINQQVSVHPHLLQRPEAA